MTGEWALKNAIGLINLRLHRRGGESVLPERPSIVGCACGKPVADPYSWCRSDRTGRLDRRSGTQDRVAEAARQGTGGETLYWGASHQYL